MTGEAAPVDKRTAALGDEELPLGDRSNMAFKGTIVTYGRARGIAVATGMTTELGKVATQLEAVPELRTPLQKRLAAFRPRLALAILIVCAAVFALGVWGGRSRSASGH